MEAWSDVHLLGEDDVWSGSDEVSNSVPSQGDILHQYQHGIRRRCTSEMQAISDAKARQKPDAIPAAHRKPVAADEQKFTKKNAVRSNRKRYFEVSKDDIEHIENTSWTNQHTAAMADTLNMWGDMRKRRRHRQVALKVNDNRESCFSSMTDTAAFIKQSKEFNEMILLGAYATIVSCCGSKYETLVIDPEELFETRAAHSERSYNDKCQFVMDRLHEFHGDQPKIKGHEVCVECFTKYHGVQVILQNALHWTDDIDTLTAVVNCDTTCCVATSILQR
jgi:hypothetical protein